MENICFTQHYLKPYSFTSDNLIFLLPDASSSNLMIDYWQNLRAHANLCGDWSGLESGLSMVVLSLIGGDMDGLEAAWTWRMAKEEPRNPFHSYDRGLFTGLVGRAPP